MQSTLNGYNVGENDETWEKRYSANDDDDDDIYASLYYLHNIETYCIAELILGSKGMDQWFDVCSIWNTYMI